MIPDSDTGSPEAPRAGEIVIYSSGLCGFCMAAKRLLDGKGWSYVELSVDGNPGRRQSMTNITGRTSVPQIFFGETHVGGFDDLAELESDGDLDPLYLAMQDETD